MLLLLGALLTFLAHLRWGIGLLAWLAPVPWLAHLRRARGRRPRLALAATVIATWIVTTFKIYTAPLPVIAPLMFGVTIGVFQLVPYLGWDLARRRLGARGAILAFPALVVIAELAQVRLTPLASWGATAYTQLGDLPLLQVASLAGLAGVSFLIAWVAAAIESRERREIAIAVGAVVIAHGFGVARLAIGEGRVATARVAAVTTDATFGGPPVPGPDELAQIDDALFARTRTAAHAGAKLVVWPEAATLVWAKEEPAFLARAAAVAKDEQIELVAAYVTPEGSDPFPFHNHYVWLRPDGTTAFSYEKQQPVPGEPSIAGDRAPAIVDTAAGRATGVICYDGDFPALVREAVDGADLLVIPSSDWRGIDPIHTEMAAVRAIENGVSVLRSTRMGESAGVDPYGRVHASLSWFDSDERIMMVTLPTHRVWTLYGAIGDTPVIACALLLAFALIRGSSRGRVDP